MSGHITITSRGSSVGSSSSRCRIASRSTSTWRARPWQAWTWTLRSVAASSGRWSSLPGSGGPGGVRSARTSAWMRVSRVPSRCSTGCSWDVTSGPSTSCSSRESWPQEASRRFAGSVAVGSWARRVTSGARRAISSHSAGDGCRRKRWTSRPAASARRTCRWPGGQAGQTEEREPLGQVREPGFLAQPRARGLEPGRGVRHVDPLGEPAPQLGLPLIVLPRLPAADHLRAVQGVAVVEVGEVADGGEAARAIGLQVLGQRRQPRLLERAVDDIEQRPHEPLGQPRVALRVDPGRGRDRPGGEAAGEREVHVGADSEADREPLRQPALHAARGDGDDLGGERVGGRLREQRAERGDEAVGPVGSVDVEHGVIGQSFVVWRT